MKVIFMGTPDFSVVALDAIVAAGHEVVAVYSQPPRPSGRGQKLRNGPVHTRALALGLPVFHPDNFKDPDDVAVFESHGADVAVVVAYGLLLPQVILDAPQAGCLNIHASLLPRWRGAAPIHRAIMAGDQETGVGIMQMEAGLDTGPVRHQVETPIQPTETTGQLHDHLAAIGAQAIVDVLSDLDGYPAIAQPENGVTYAHKIDKSEARIDWSDTAEYIDRLIRGLSPFPGAWCEMDGARLKLLASCLTQGEGEPGQILQGSVVACGSGAVEITKMQIAGKKAQSAEEFTANRKMPKALT